MMCKCMAGFTVEYVLNEKGCPVCKCTPLSQASSKTVNIFGFFTLTSINYIYLIQIHLTKRISQ